MTTTVQTRAGLTFPSRAPSLRRARALELAGSYALRYGLVAILVLFGALKFTPAEGEGIRPLVEHSPFMSWLYAVLSAQGTSRLIGTIELATAILLATRPLSPRAAVVGSALATVTFLLTLSFLFSTPGVLAPDNPSGAFLLKDLVLLGAALATGGEALRAAAEQEHGRA